MMKGINVSKWQGNIDFNKVKAAGIQFVRVHTMEQLTIMLRLLSSMLFLKFVRLVLEQGK